MLTLNYSLHLICFITFYIYYLTVIKMDVVMHMFKVVDCMHILYWWSHKWDDVCWLFWTGFKKFMKNISYEGEVQFLPSDDAISEINDETRCRTGQVISSCATLLSWEIFWLVLHFSLCIIIAVIWVICEWAVRLSHVPIVNQDNKQLSVF